MDLNGRKVLLIAPKFHHYQDEIIKSLEKYGAEVTYFEEVIYKRIYTLVRNKIRSPFNKIFDKVYFNNILEKVEKNQYDIFLLIRGELIETSFLVALRDKLKTATFVMYQWDSLIHNDYKEKIKYFEKVLTFDLYDSKELKVDYLPLFFTEEYSKISHETSDIQYDIVFYGTYHSDRLDVIKKIMKECKDKNLIFKHHLYASKMQKMKLWLKGVVVYQDLKLLKSYTVPLSKIIQVYSKSKTVLDIEMTNQTGLTIRTIEALGANRKLLTTNKGIVDSELYDEKYIQVLDRKLISLNKDFFVLQKPTDKYNHLHIDNWLKNILKKTK